MMGLFVAVLMVFCLCVSASAATNAPVIEINAVVSSDGSRVYENRTGNPFMALGGMGDLLAGVIGARWAYLKGDPFLAAASAVWLHGAASDAVVADAIDASVVNTAGRIGSMRIRLDGAGGGK
jgi:hydroxyethylthiazole kinase-like sugar kinase family protein